MSGAPSSAAIAAAASVAYQTQADGDAANPFAGINADAMAIIGTLLGKVYQSDEWEPDPCDGWLADWRAARGEDAFDHWRWWIGEVDGETYALDFATRAEAIAAAPKAIASGDFQSPDGRFEIVEARCWADDVQAADEIIWFAEKRNREILSIEAGGGQ